MTQAQSTLGLSVLVVDDQRTMRGIVRGFLNQMGIRTVHEADNGRAALDWLLSPEGARVDAVLCDLHMPDMDGMDLCAKLRRSKGRMDGVPFILVTGEKDSLVLEVTRQVGANAVLHKPFSAADLKRTLEQSLGFSGWE